MYVAGAGCTTAAVRQVVSCKQVAQIDYPSRNSFSDGFDGNRSVLTGCKCYAEHEACDYRLTAGVGGLHGGQILGSHNAAGPAHARRTCRGRSILHTTSPGATLEIQMQRRASQ